MNVAHDNSGSVRRNRDEEWHERAKWEPTKEEFERYLAREVEMAKVNLARGNPANTTLHTAATITAAQGALDRETGNAS